VGKGSGVAAGSIVTKDVLQYSIVAGNPAKRIKNGK
jgi:acetyltransferase-like isoleucine patch superfamily enzyme